MKERKTYRLCPLKRTSRREDVSLDEEDPGIYNCATTMRDGHASSKGAGNDRMSSVNPRGVARRRVAFANEKRANVSIPFALVVAAKSSAPSIKDREILSRAIEPRREGGKSPGRRTRREVSYTEKNNLLAQRQRKILLS